MKAAAKTILLFFTFTLLSIAPATAEDVSKGINCPPGWSDNQAARGDNRVKQCISPSLDASVELYVTPGNKIPLKNLLDNWTTALKQQGFPLHKKVTETKGHVSGGPAIFREYEGKANGKTVESLLAASRHNGINYIFQGSYPDDDREAEQLVRHSLKTWNFPEDSSKEDTPYDSPKNKGTSGTFRNIGGCWAWGLWKAPSGASVVILPDGRAIFDGQQLKHWRPTDEEDTIIMEIPGKWGGGSAMWTHPAGRHDVVIQEEFPEARQILFRESWEYNYKGKAFKACHH
ncbi:hypothetical protein [Desulfovibrio sp. JC010]|uniref:hypothetical protein n=1 Tax=Desulfovibrio sp. JC010 TaxID=2593641 RepID=UPI0013D5A65C|nr:hypothetical protein [Desulfovibrio sp. JC010]NDV26757.1 hypothetical protein [Desulfovibrio sp. JC010]